MFSHYFLFVIVCYINISQALETKQNEDLLLQLKLKGYDIKYAEMEKLIGKQNVRFAEFNREILRLEILMEREKTKFAEQNRQIEVQNTLIANQNTMITKQNTKLCELKSQIKQTSETNTSSGVVFTRWGRSDCPAGISTPVYNGTLGGSHFDHTGAAVNHLCMPHDPTWDVNKLYKSAYVGYVYGGHYAGLPDSSLNGHIPPCAVCRAALFSTKVVIPGRNTCYPGWTKAYDGELTTGGHEHKAASEYICLDRQPQKGVKGGDAGFWLTSVLAKCGALPCPPYQDEALITCVVCLK